MKPYEFRPIITRNECCYEFLGQRMWFYPTRMRRYHGIWTR